MRLRQSLRLTSIGVALSTSVMGLTTIAPHAEAIDPSVRIIAVEGHANDGLSFGELDWHEGRIYTVRSSNALGREITSWTDEGSSSGSAASDRRSEAKIPETWWATDSTYYRNQDAFAVGRNGEFYLQAPYRNSSRTWGVGVLSRSGAVTPPVAPAGSYVGGPRGLSIGYYNESIELEPEGDGLIVAGELNLGGGIGVMPGAVARMPLPVPENQQDADLLVSNTAYTYGDPSSRHDPPFTEAQQVKASTHAWVDTLGDATVKSRYLYAAANYFIHRVDRRTDRIVSICCGDQWSSPPVEGARAMDTWFGGFTAGPVADRDGNVYVADMPGRFHEQSTIWQIRPDGTIHRVAGGGSSEPAEGVAPTEMRLTAVRDLILDPAGNLYVSTADSQDAKRIIRFNGVAVADTAPGSPRDLRVSEGDGALDVTWAEPHNDGGQPVTGYTVRLHPANAVGTAQDEVVTVTGAAARFEGLNNGTSYDVSVFATNPVGDGPAATTAGSPIESAAALTVPSTATAGQAVTLDAASSRVPEGSTFTFYCDGRYQVPVGPASTQRTATCTYPRGSNDEGFAAKVVITHAERTWTATDSVFVEDPPGTIEGSAGFTLDAPESEVTAAGDGSLSSGTCGQDSANATCVNVRGARIALAAAPGTLRPGSVVRIHHGDEETLQAELGSGVEAQGGFAITWVDAQGRKYDLARPLVVTVTPTESSGAQLRRYKTSAALAPGWDVGAAFQAWGQSFASGVTNVVNTIGSGLQWAGNALSNFWASAVQSMTKPNSSRNNDVYSCSSTLLLTGSNSYRCEGTLTKLSGVPTDRIAAFDAGGKVVSAGGANVVSAGGMNVVSAGGANVVSAGGANLRLTLASNSVISAGGANVVSAGGANVVSAGGANVVSAGGGNVISAGGANVVSSGGANIAPGAVAMTMALTRDPGFAFTTPTDVSTPTANVTVSSDRPAVDGVYPYGSTVTATIEAVASGGKTIKRVGYEVTGAHTTRYTVWEGNQATTKVSEPGTSTLRFSATDDQLVESEVKTTQIVIAQPRTASAPTGVTATGGVDRTSALVTWTPPQDAGDFPVTGYRVTGIDQGLATDGSAKAADRVVEISGAGTSAQMTGLTEGHTYIMKVQALTEAGAGDSSALSAPVTLAVAPQSPSRLAASVSDADVSLSWSAPSDDGGLPVTRYLVSRGDSESGPFTEIAESAGTTYVDSTVAKDTTYYYVVKAVNHIGTSAASNPTSAKVQGPTPEEPKAQSLTFEPLPARTYGDSAIALHAAATSGLTVRFATLSSAVCSVSGDRVSILGVGTCSIEAAQPGDGTWAPANGVTRSFIVQPAPLSVQASPASMLKRGERPGVGPIYAGFVAGDSVRDLRAPAVCHALPRLRKTSCSSVIAPNYRVTYRPGVLVIKKRGYAITSTAAVHWRARQSARHSFRVQGPDRLSKLKIEGKLPPGVRIIRNGWRVSLAGKPQAVGQWRLRVRVVRSGRTQAVQVLRLFTW